MSFLVFCVERNRDQTDKGNKENREKKKRKLGEKETLDVAV